MAMQFEKRLYWLPQLFVVLLFSFAMTNISVAQEFRKMNRIARPPAKQALVPKPSAASVNPSPTDVQAGQMKPVSRQTAEQAIEMLVKAWNGNTLGTVLADNFFDRSRLLDAMGSNVPRDASFSVLAIQDVQTLKQKYETGSSGKVLNSTVSITVHSQLTFNDASGKFQRLEGVNEYIMHIRQKSL